MRGIMILGFNKSPGAYIDTQFPDNICERLDVKTSDLMNIYALHRMRRMEPNYLQMKIKNVSVASFYTGFSFKHYVGRPNYTITVFLSDGEFPPAEFEGQMRRAAFDLLPRRDEFNFTRTFEEYYDKLRRDELEVYWEEYIEGEGSKIATIQADLEEDEEIEEETDGTQELSFEEYNFDSQFEEFAKDELKGEVKDLHKVLTEKDEKIKQLTQKITEQASAGSDSNEQVNILKSQIDEQNDKLDDWSIKLADIAEKNAILMETVRKLTEMSMQQTEETEGKMQQIHKLRKDLQAKEEKMEEANNTLMNLKIELAEAAKDHVDPEILEQLKEENAAHLNTIVNLNTECEELTSQLQAMQAGGSNTINEEIIELKKELKVVRRERDHYKNLVIENDLL